MIDSNDKSILKEVNQVIIELLIHAPFFGRLLAKSVKVIDQKHFGVSLISFDQESVQLCINPTYWQNHLKGDNEKQTLQLRKSTLKRQLIHFIFNHDLLIHNFENEETFILSAELVVNQYLEEEEQIIHPFISELFQKLNLSPFEKVQYYYEIIFKNRGEANLKKSIEFQSNHLKHYKTWKNQLISKSDKELESHFRRQFILSPLQSVVLLEEDTLPPPLIAYLNFLKNNNQQSINWRRVLRLFCNNSNQTKLVNTIHRPSKRFGTFPGSKVRRQSRILIAVDTSASIKQVDLEQFFNEIHQLWKQGTEIIIVECDTIIHRKYKYKGAPPNIISGRGNTDFNEPIWFSNEVFQPDALIYFTDGFGLKPRIASKKPILWIINKKGIKSDSKAWNDLPGRKILLSLVH
jgi:predicted metal-dependent peptidase